MLRSCRVPAAASPDCVVETRGSALFEADAFEKLKSCQIEERPGSKRTTNIGYMVWPLSPGDSTADTRAPCESGPSGLGCLRERRVARPRNRFGPHRVRRNRGRYDELQRVPPTTTVNAASASSSNSSKSDQRSRNTRSTSSVVQFPSLTHTTLGGGPRRKLS